MKIKFKKSKEIPNPFDRFSPEILSAFALVESEKLTQGYDLRNLFKALSDVIKRQEQQIASLQNTVDDMRENGIDY